MNFLKSSKAKKLALVALVVLLLAPSQLFAKSAEQIDLAIKIALDTFKNNKGGQAMLDKAYGILVFPEVYKGGIGIGGEYGEGALMRNGKVVNYYSTVSASVGWQLGGQKKAMMYLFMTKEAYDKFVNSDGWKVGVDASVAVLAFGAGAEIDTNYEQTQPVVACIFDQKGLMYDLSLEGTKISIIKR